jgi:hypothetical protein
MRHLRLLLLCLACTTLSATPGFAAGVGPSHIRSFASVVQQEGQSPSSLQRLVEINDFGDLENAYARLDDRNTAFQSVTGINAVRAGGVFWNGLPFNEIASSTTFQLMGTFAAADRRPHDLYMDFLVFPGVVGLSRYATAGSTASVEFKVSSLRAGVTNPVVARAAVTLTGGTPSGLPTVTADPIFQTQPGIHTLDGFTLHAVGTQPIFATAHLGEFRHGDSVNVSYHMTATVRMPGYEIAGVAMLGDPFSLRTDEAAEIARYFPESTLPFELRAVAAVPEPATWAMSAAGLVVVLGAVAARRRKQRRTTA